MMAFPLKSHIDMNINFILYFCQKKWMFQVPSPRACLRLNLEAAVQGWILYLPPSISLAPIRSASKPHSPASTSTVEFL